MGKLISQRGFLVRHVDDFTHTGATGRWVARRLQPGQHGFRAWLDDPDLVLAKMNDCAKRCDHASETMALTTAKRFSVGGTVLPTAPLLLSILPQAVGQPKPARRL